PAPVPRASARAARAPPAERAADTTGCRYRWQNDVAHPRTRAQHRDNPASLHRTDRPEPPPDALAGATSHANRLDHRPCAARPDRYRAKRSARAIRNRSDAVRTNADD